MLQRYKEIFYGLLFGFGAALIDIHMHARMEHGSFWTELVQPQPAMIFYRIAFISFGLIIGWLLWQKNRRERDFRNLKETVLRFHHEIGAPILLMHTKLQLLLTREDLNLSHEAEELVRFVYEKSQQLQSLTKEKLPKLHSSQ